MSESAVEIVKLITEMLETVVLAWIAAELRVRRNGR